VRVLWPALATALVPLVAAPLTTWLTNVLKKSSSWVDAQPATTKRVIVTIIATLLNYVGLAFGIDLPDAVAEVTTEAVTSILLGLVSALAAMGIYHVRKAEPSQEITTP
jgi:hypothetical protein